MSRHEFRSRDSMRDCGDSLSTSHNKQGSDRAAHSLLSTRPRPSAHGLYVESLRRKPRVFHASRISRTYVCPFCGPDRLQTRAGSGSEPHRSGSWRKGRHHVLNPAFPRPCAPALRVANRIAGILTSVPLYTRAFSSNFAAPSACLAATSFDIHSPVSLLASDLDTPIRACVT